MSEAARDRESLMKLIQGLKNRLLAEEPVESILTELARLEASIAALRGKFERLDAKFRMLQAALLERDILVATGEAISELPNEQVIGADHLLDAADGFYGLEHDPEGRPFRWTGPTLQFRFTLYVDRTAPRRLEVSFLWACDPEMFPAIQCFVDRKALPVRYTNDGATHRLIVDVSARTTADPGATTVICVLPKVISAKQMDPKSQDNRTLGVAFRELRIAAAGKEDQSVLQSQGIGR